MSTKQKTKLLNEYFPMHGDMSKEHEEYIWELYQEDPTDPIVFKAFCKLVANWTVKFISQKTSDSMPENNIVQSCLIAVSDALKKFDPSKGRFITIYQIYARNQVVYDYAELGHPMLTFWQSTKKKTREVDGLPDIISINQDYKRDFSTSEPLEAFLPDLNEVDVDQSLYERERFYILNAVALTFEKYFIAKRPNPERDLKIFRTRIWDRYIMDVHDEVFLTHLGEEFGVSNRRIHQVEIQLRKAFIEDCKRYLEPSKCEA